MESIQNRIGELYDQIMAAPVYVELLAAQEAANELINYYTREAGVRQLERTFGQICRKLARKVVEGDGKQKDIVIGVPDQILRQQ